MLVAVDVNEKWVARFKIIGHSYYQDPRDYASDNRNSMTFISQKECDEWVEKNSYLCETLEITHTKVIK